MKKFLVVVDMQNDFVDGALGTPEAQAIVGNVVREIENFDGEVFATLDTHYENYLSTAEGKKLPVPHCIKGTDGWLLNADVQKALEAKGFTPAEKGTFGCVALPNMLAQKVGTEDFAVELVGLCTDICVVSNALLLKAIFPERAISVKESCCAGVTPELHNAAIATMKSCQIDII
ncbi:MAG: cysteine hydrolase [Eubacterium sp.]|nr:cysteine hydrolase [Eubacterium sp.]MBR0412247.1 cysteine hydrolase [Eubacterium sp.]